MCVGAAFDFHAGTKPMAPGWMQRHGFEWLFRLCCEPLSPLEEIPGHKHSVLPEISCFCAGHCSSPIQVHRTIKGASPVKRCG